ncbi:MAG: acyltransferase [Bacteroidaceae bacterium]|nr:acyltransferase [Bacteroidaceae bacterium]
MNIKKTVTKISQCAHSVRLLHSADLPKLDISFEAGYALRGIAMLMIMFIHSINEYAIYTSELSTTLLVPQYGQLSCSIFFFMSGYGLYFSLSKQRGALLSYLWLHVKKLLFPFFLAFIGVLLVLHIFKNADNAIYSIKPWNILTLTMPEGTDMWFFKVILIDYVATILLFMLPLKLTNRIGALFCLHALAIVLCYLLNVPGCWFFSNLAFPLGMYFAHYKGHLVQARNTLLLACLFSLVIYYTIVTLYHTNAPLEIFVNTMCPLLIVLLMSKIPLSPPRWLQYIGKNSLSFYLFNVPIMLAIPASSMHWVTYFILNLVITWIATILYTPLQRKI